MITVDASTHPSLFLKKSWDPQSRKQIRSFGRLDLGSISGNNGKKVNHKSPKCNFKMHPEGLLATKKMLSEVPICENEGEVQIMSKLGKVTKIV